MDTGTFGMKEACEELTAEKPDADTLFYQQSPYMCTRTPAIITFLDLDANGVYDMEDQILSEIDGSPSSLDEDACCSALLEDETLDHYWDYACRSVPYE